MILERLINIENIKKVKGQFSQNPPFDHVVIDNFFKDEIARDLVREFPNFDSEVWHKYENPLEIKKTCNNWNFFPKLSYSIFSLLNSQTFVELLSREFLNDIKLYSDPGLNGGGWHIHGVGGKLNTHLDYSIHPKLNLQRRLNLIIYLNPDWNPDWGGELGFWGNNSSIEPGELVKSISCIFNRAVIFDTTQNSWHGLPSPIKCPDNQFRMSLAVYYLSDVTSSAIDRSKALYAPTDDQKNSTEILELIKVRSQEKLAHKVYQAKTESSNKSR